MQVDGVGPDIVNVSWDIEEFLKRGIHQFRLIADPSVEPFSVGDVMVDTSSSRGSIIKNLIPSTRYLIYVEEISKANRLHTIHYVTTRKSGGLTLHC